MMKRFLLSLAVLLTVYSTAFGQRSSMSVSSVVVPQYLTSGSNSEAMITYARLRFDGLMPSSTFKYIARCLDASELDTAILLDGAGSTVYMDGSNHRHVSSHSFSTAGGHDTIETDMTGSADFWIGLVGDGSSTFADGNAVYIGLTLINTTASPMDTSYLYLADSLTVISFGTNASSNEGTGVYGESYADPDYFVALYDDENGIGRPLSITSMEGGTYTGATLPTRPSFYSSNVHNQKGMWGSIIPNDLNNGVRSFSILNDATGLVEFFQKDADGTWGPNSVSTANPSGGSGTAIEFKKEDAPMVPTEISFVSSSISYTEADTNAIIVIERKYSGSESQQVDLSVTGGTATDKEDFISTYNNFNVKFNPGLDVKDTLKIELKDDQLTEGTENIFLRLTNPLNADLGDIKTYEIKILDNDEAMLSFAQPTVSVNEKIGKLEIELKMDASVKVSSDIDILIKSKSDSTRVPSEFALGKNSYSDTSISLGLSTGPDSAKIVAYIGDDVSYDWDDTIVLVLRQKTGLATIKDSTMLIILEDNDGPSSIMMVGSDVTVDEGVGSVPVKITVTKKKDAGADFALRLLTAESSAKGGLDFTFNPVSQLKSIDNTTPDTIVFNIPIEDDDDYEGLETIKFGLIDVSNTTILKPDTFLIRVQDNDLPIYNIATVSAQTKSDGQVDSLGVNCRINGVVYGVNMRTTGLSFTVRDYTGGIQVFSSVNTFKYNVKEGDSVLVQGKIGQFQGTAQMESIDTVIRKFSGVTLRNPVVVTDINEQTESELVQLNRVRLIDPFEWPVDVITDNTWRYVRVETSSGHLDTLHIDAETNIDGTPAPEGYFNVAGIGSQFDNRAPYKEKYYLTPRSLNDFTNATLPVIRFEKTSETITELADSLVMNLRVNPTDENFKVDLVQIGGTAVSPIDFDYQTRTISVVKNNNFYTVKANISDDTEGDGTKTLIFALRNMDGAGSIGADSVLTVTILDNEPSSVKTFANASLKLFPNPNTGSFYIYDADYKVQRVKVLGLDGRVYFEGARASSAGKSVKLDIAANAGIYMVEVETIDGVHYTEKMIIN